jgi:carboxymethylenebutenolidase
VKRRAAVLLAFVAAGVALAVVGDARAEVETSKSLVRRGDVEVPVEIVRPRGAGPFPAVLYVHARRGLEDEDRAKLRSLAAHGFLVAAPDWQSGRFIERWPVAHDEATEGDVAAALDLLRARPDACRGPVAVLGVSRGGYYALRLAARRPDAIGAVASYYGHFQHPHAPEPEQLYGVAPEVNQIRAPWLMLIGDQDFELRRINTGRAFYALYERGVPVALQMYPLARRAFDFRRDQSPEEKVAALHAERAVRDWFVRHLALPAPGRCPG